MVEKGNVHRDHVQRKKKVQQEEIYSLVSDLSEHRDTHTQNLELIKGLEAC